MVCACDGVLGTIWTIQCRAARLKNEWPETGKWFGVEPLSPIRGSVHGVRSNYGISKIKSELIGLTIYFMSIGFLEGWSKFMNFAL